MSNEQQSPPQGQHTDAAGAREDRGDRPDLRPPRGNQDVEQIDVERGEGKIERVLGW